MRCWPLILHLWLRICVNSIIKSRKESLGGFPSLILINSTVLLFSVFRLILIIDQIYSSWLIILLFQIYLHLLLVLLSSIYCLLSKCPINLEYSRTFCPKTSTLFSLIRKILIKLKIIYSLYLLLSINLIASM